MDSEAVAFRRAQLLQCLRKKNTLSQVSMSRGKRLPGRAEMTLVRRQVHSLICHRKSASK